MATVVRDALATPAPTARLRHDGVEPRPRRARRLSDHAIELIGLALGVGILTVAAMDHQLSTDVFWSLAAGQSILAHHALFGNDAFTYTEPHRRWIADEWGSEVVLASLFKAFGNVAFTIFAVGTGALSLLCTRAYARALGARGGRVAVMVVLLAMGLIGVVTQDRGLSFSLIWLPLELLILTKGRANPRWLWWLPVLFVLWVNTHGSILLGLVVLGLELGWSLLPARLLEGTALSGRSPHARQLGVVLALGVLASCLSPYGPSLLRYDLGVSFNGQIGQYIEEWGSPNFHSVQLLLSFTIPLVVLLLALRARRLMVLELTLTLGFLVATLHATRFIIYLFVAACGLAACLPARRSLSDRARRAAGALGVGLLIALVAAPSVPAGSVVSSTPVKAFDFLSDHPGRIFTEYTWGDYSIVRHRTTFVDGRTDYFSGAVLADYFAVANLTTDPDSVLSQYDVSYVVWDRGTPLYTYLSHDPRWVVVDRTAPAVVFARRSVWDAMG